MDYSPNGTLHHLLKKNKNLDEKSAFKYFIQVISAVNFLHENNFIHRDIKPENILLDDNNNVKLCDFGWCCELTVGNRITFCGTYEYMAPEVMNEMPYNHSVDLWSLGVLLYEMVQGVSPFKVMQLIIQPQSNGNNEEDYNEILKNIKKSSITFEKTISKQCEDLIRKMLSIDKNTRIKMKEIFQHPWVQGFEKEMYDEQKNSRNTDSISTKHNSTASTASIMEYRKNIKKVYYY